MFPKPDCKQDRAAKQGVRRRSRLTFREAVLAADGYRCLWCGTAKNLHACHIENRRAHNRELDKVSNGGTLCFIDHFIFDEGGKVCGRVRTANQFRIMVFEKHEKEAGFRFAEPLRKLREQEEYRRKA